MLWNQIKHHFEGYKHDLIEVVYEGMNEANWVLLFTWLEGRVSYVMTQHGYEPIDVISVNSFLTGEYGYVVTLKEKPGLSLSIISDTQLEINIELDDIQTEDDFNDFFRAVEEIAGVVKSTRYYICPEFKKEEAFIINGKLVLEL